MTEKCPWCDHEIEQIKDVSDWDAFEIDRMWRCPNCRVYHPLDPVDKPSEAGGSDG